jgi:hypothetical protein
MAGDGVTVDPNALNTFAQGVGGTTVKLAKQAMKDMPQLSTQLDSATSMLNEGQSFERRHADIVAQFGKFLLDATAGTGALADGADTIALNLTGTDNLNAQQLLRAELAGGADSAMLGLVPVSGPASNALTTQDVLDAFNPDKATANTFLATLHATATQSPPSGTAANPVHSPPIGVLPSSRPPVGIAAPAQSTAAPVVHASRQIVLPSGARVTVPADSVSQAQLARDGEIDGRTGTAEEKALLNIAYPHQDGQVPATPAGTSTPVASPTAGPSPEPESSTPTGKQKPGNPTPAPSAGTAPSPAAS